MICAVVESCSISSAQHELAEFEAVLQSGLFARAPNLESFFRYICQHHMRGTAVQLKEYNIAVEALGRAPQFDQKKDSIVRVEALRLRKRLSEYYAGPGADHPIHIVVPRGSYAPQFLVRDIAAAVPASGDQLDAATLIVAADEIPSPNEPEPLPLPHHIPPANRPWWGRVGWAILSICLALAIFGVFKWRLVLGEKGDSQLGNETASVAAGEVVPAEFRMLAGYHGRPVIDAQGREWGPDSYYSGGRSTPLPQNLAIQEVVGSHLLMSARKGKFRYDIPLREGVFELHLYFVETEYGIGNPKGGGDGSRLFQLAINGRPQVDLFDVHAEAGGPNRLFIRVFKDISRAADGKVHVSFSPLRDTAILNAVEILPSEPGRIRPIRVVAQDHPVTDSNGQIWSADQYVIGGTLVVRHDAKFQNSNFAVYQGERFGNFTYHFPLAPGKYKVTLHFAETWFGTPSAAISSREHRLFDVYANGLALMRKFDILQEAGAPNKGIEKVFDGLEPNAQGELNIQFVPLTNYAEVNAIEVVETS